MSTTVSSEACLLQGRLGEWARKSSQRISNKFNDRGMLRNKFCSTEAGHIESNDVLHLAYDSSVSENDCIIEHGVSNSKIDSNGSYDKLVSPCKDNLNVYLERNDWMTWLGNLKKTKLFTQNYSNYAGNLSAKSPK